MAELVDVTIGFQASMPLAVRVPKKALDALLGALGSEGWHDLETHEGRVRLNLQHVTYVRTTQEEHRVGFGIAS
jgi:hypothetical protein